MWNYYNNNKINKQFHKYNFKGYDKRSFFINNGLVGIRTLEPGFISTSELKAVNLFLKKNIKKSGKIWYRFFINHVKTKKPLETRMGKGKGNFDTYVSAVKSGRIIIEIKTPSLLISERLLDQVRRKISVKTEVVYFKV